MSEYGPKHKEYTINYIHENYKRVEIRFKKEIYDNEIKPAIDRSGMSQNAFIMDAIKEKIARQNKV